MELNPQQQKFLEVFLDPNSETWGNYRQSALKAGYSQDYADNISVQMPDWLNDNLGKSRRVIKAEKNLDTALDGGLDDPDKGGKPIQMKATELVLKSHKKSLYSDRTELTGKDGAELQTLLVRFIDNKENGNEKE